MDRTKGGRTVIPKNLPRNLAIAEELRARISRGDYAERGLPAERALMVEFGVSRQTVRVALQRLSSDGLIDRQVGRGTTVTPKATASFAAMGSLADLLGGFSIQDSITISAREEPADQYPEAARKFGLESGPIFRLLRILASSQGPYAVSQLFTAPEYATKLPVDEIPLRPFIELLEESLGEVTAKVHQSISAISADRETASFLRIRPDVALVSLSRTYTNSLGKPLLHVELVCNPNLFRPSMDFVRERPGHS